VDGDLPSRASSWARSIVSLSGIGSSSAIAGATATCRRCCDLSCRTASPRAVVWITTALVARTRVPAPRLGANTRLRAPA